MQDHVTVAAAAADAHIATLSALNIPEDVKAALRPYAPQVCQALFGVVTAGVDAGLHHFGFLGSIAEGVVDPMLAGLEPKAEAALEALLV